VEGDEGRDKNSQVLVAHVYNPSYFRRHPPSGGWWFEASPGEVVHETYLENSHHKKKA
jgi:hypothetical protein